MSRPLPSLSARLADVQSSPVRDILRLTQRADLISFAGGLPAPELFPAEMVAQAFSTALAPTFQNPTGRTLPEHRRRRLAQIAAEHILWIVEDDPYGELRYDGEPLAPVASHAGARDRTISVSSLSKVLAPGLRIGFLRAPAALPGPLTVAKQAADLYTSTVDQRAARISLQTGRLDDHIADICAEYRRRRDALLAGLDDALPAGSTSNHPDGGMFVWARLPDGCDATEPLAAALRHDVAFVPGAPFYATDPDPRTLRLSFTAHPAVEIASGLRLGAAAGEVCASGL